jgi:hypothetical protein
MLDTAMGQRPTAASPRLFDGLSAGFLDDPAFARIVVRDLRAGQYRNRGDHPGYFTRRSSTTPTGVRRRSARPGPTVVEEVGVEGPGWWLPREFGDWWGDPA